MGASCDFTQIIIPYVLLQIYRMQVSQLNKENFDWRNLYTVHVYICTSIQGYQRSDMYHCIFNQIPVSTAIYINHDHSLSITG